LPATRNKTLNASTINPSSIWALKHPSEPV
jgi:hypothetical protein